MDDLTVSDAMTQSLIIEKVKHVLDSRRQHVVSTSHAKESLKKVVDVDLKSALETCNTPRTLSLQQ